MNEREEWHNDNKIIVLNEMFTVLTEAWGANPSVIVRAVRTREACQLLTGSDFKLTGIGYWCGFSGSPHFSREFRRALGVPPALYRQTAA
jgi:AraC-like DNA-binding protein